MAPAPGYAVHQPHNEDEELSPIRVCVKLVQPSRLYTVDRAEPDPDKLARGEAAAYDHLEELQGLSIPYFFGKRPVSILILSAARQLTK